MPCIRAAISTATWLSVSLLMYCAQRTESFSIPNMNPIAREDPPHWRRQILWIRCFQLHGSLWRIHLYKHSGNVSARAELFCELYCRNINWQALSANRALFSQIQLHLEIWWQEPDFSWENGWNWIVVQLHCGQHLLFNSETPLIYIYIYATRQLASLTTLKQRR